MKHVILLLVLCCTTIIPREAQAQTKKEKKEARKEIVEAENEMQEEIDYQEKRIAIKLKKAEKKIRLNTAKPSIVKLYLETDVAFATSANDARKEASSGIGTLGLVFEQNLFYGSANFTVFSKNEEIITEDPAELILFGTSLLIPQNSASNISNFYISLGTKSFYRWRNYRDSENFFSWSKIGCNGALRINNTTWVKDTVITPVTINSFSLEVTYLLLNLNIKESNQHARMYVSFGLSTRRLGGDYGLEQNKDIRNIYLGTDKLGFNGSNFRVRLELAQFYGEMNLSYFPRKDNIAGFSGDQAIINIGLGANLGLFANEASKQQNKVSKKQDKESQKQKIKAEPQI